MSIYVFRLTPEGCCSSIKFEYPAAGVVFNLRFAGIYNNYEHWIDENNSNYVMYVKSTTENQQGLYRYWWISAHGLGVNTYYGGAYSTETCPPLDGSWDMSNPYTFTCMETQTSPVTTTTTPSSGGEFLTRFLIRGRHERYLGTHWRTIFGYQ